MNTVIKLLSTRFYLKEFLILFFAFFLTEGIFSWIFVRNSLWIEDYQKLLLIFCYGFMLYSYQQLKKSERLILILFSLLMLKLILQSLAKYDSFFRQLTMFTVLAPVVYVFFVKYLLQKMELDLLGFMAKFYLISYIAFMLLFGRGFSFSLNLVEMADYGPFSGDSRIIHASHIFMIIVPFLYYLNKFVITKKNKYLAVFAFCFAIILVHQHRSVWSSALVALFFYFFISIRNRIKLSGLWNTVFTGALILIVAYFFVVNLHPRFIDFLSDRFSDILDPSKEGSTGNFRIQQSEVYSKLFLQRPVFGWTFQGFEMPNPLVDWWPPMTGQHFHEGYIEMLFYHGIVGLLFKYGFLVYLFIQSFSRRLSSSSIILIAFCISAFVFSFSYVLPLVFWGFVAMALYHIEKDKSEPAIENGEPKFTSYSIA